MKSCMPCVAMLLAVVIGVVACGAQGNDGRPGGPGNQGNRPQGTASGTEKALAMGNALPTLVAYSAYQSRETLVKAVYGATRLSGGAATGRAVNTGTLSMAGPFGRFTYSPQPTDKLVVKLPKITHEFRVHDVKGNLRAATPEAFLASNHTLHYHHRVAGVGDMEIRVSQVGDRFTTGIDGTFTFEARDYATKMKAAGTSYFQSGFGGFESKGDYRLTGEVKREGLQLSVNERHAFIMVSQNKSAAHQATDTSDNVLKVGDDTYRWEKVRIVKSFRDGKPSYPHRDWKVSGKILKNGEAFGTYKLTQKSVPRDHKFKMRGMVLIQLITKAGPIQLQSFNLY